MQIPLTGKRGKHGVFDPGWRNRIKQNVTIRCREGCFVRDLFIKSVDLGESAGLLARFVGMALANGSSRAAARLPHFRRPGGTRGLGGIYPQGEYGHQDLDEGFQVHNHNSRPMTIPRVYFYIPQPMEQSVAAGAVLLLTMEPHVAMEFPKGLETVVPVWSQWACFIGQ